MIGTFAFVYRNRHCADGEGGLPRGPALASMGQRTDTVGSLAYFNTPKMRRRMRSPNAAYSSSHLPLLASTDIGYMSRKGNPRAYPGLTGAAHRHGRIAC